MLSRAIACCPVLVLVQVLVLVLVVLVLVVELVVVVWGWVGGGASRCFSTSASTRSALLPNLLSVQQRQQNT